MERKTPFRRRNRVTLAANRVGNQIVPLIISIPMAALIVNLNDHVSAAMDNTGLDLRVSAVIVVDLVPVIELL